MEQIKQLLKDCWEYHGDFIKSEGPKDFKKRDLEDYLDDLTGEGWEDIFWFAGKLSGLQEQLLDQETLDALEAVIDYSYEDEEEHYKENPDKGHIFLSLKKLQKFLNEQKK